MNKELLKELSIDENKGLKEILEELENKQFECLERLENAKDDRRDALELQLSKIDKEISDIKEQIRTIKSGIIIDDGNKSNEAVSNERKQEEKTDSPEVKNEKVNKQVESIKAKEEERQAKEAEKQKKASEKAAKEAQASVGLSQDSSGKASSINSDPELTNALVSYKKGDYNKAFEGFKKLAEKDDETAQYMLANMYHRGEGISQSDERAEYWMKRAADGGFLSAQLDYGILKLANNNNDDTIILEGLHYIGMAADQDDKQAMLKYIEVARKQIGGKSAYERAIGYCDKLISQTNDSYDSANYENAKKDIDLLRKDAIAQERKIKGSTRLSIIGSIITLLGALYLLGGVHPLMWETNSVLKVFLDAGRFLILPIDIIWNTLSPLMNQNGFFGIELIIIGELFISAGDYFGKKKIARFFVGLRKIGCIGIVIWHFVALLMEGRSIFTAFGWYIIIIALAYFVGKALGLLLGKILRTR